MNIQLVPRSKITDSGLLN